MSRYVLIELLTFSNDIVSIKGYFNSLNEIRTYYELNVEFFNDGIELDSMLEEYGYVYGAGNDIIINLSCKPIISKEIYIEVKDNLRKMCIDQILC